MEGEEIARIKEILKREPRGLSIRQITDQLDINRNLVAKYLDMLLVSGQAEMRTIGVAKMYYLSQRVPISALMDFSSDFIVVLDEDFKVIQINDNFLRFSKKSREKILGKTIGRETVPLLESAAVQEGFSEALRGKEVAIDIEWPENGNGLYFRAKFIPTVLETGRMGVTAILEDTTEIKRAEQSLRSALAEKEILLREINQRINDNLQLVSSLVHLQMGATNDERARDVLVETQNRILSLAFVYQHLGQSRNLGESPLSEFFKSLVDSIFQAYRVSEETIRTTISVADISLPIHNATAVGLIVNELVSFSIRNSFNEGTRGDLQIVISGGEKSGYRLMIRNTGKKFPADLDPKTSGVLGLQIAHTIATSELGGQMRIMTDDGNIFLITFPGGAE